MAAPRLILAKYAPDLRRMEPRNVGVILWSNGHIAAKFLGEGEDGKPSRIPRRICMGDASNFREWIKFWRTLLEKPVLQYRGSPFVPRSDPEFMDIFRSHTRGNYLLVDAAYLMEVVSADDMKDAVDEFFDELVVRHD